MKNSTYAKETKGLCIPLFFCGAGIYLEIMFHAFVFGMEAAGVVSACLWGGVFGGVLALLYAYLPRIIGKVVSGLLLCAAVILAGVQLIYHAVFGTLMQLSLIRMGGDVIDQYGDVIRSTMLENGLRLCLLLLPLVVMVVLFILRGTGSDGKKPRRFANVVLACLLLMWIVNRVLSGGFGLLRSASIPTEHAYQRLGLTGGTLWDLASPLRSDQANDYTTGIEGAAAAQTYSSAAYHVLDLDFEALAATTEDPVLQELDAYFATVVPTAKNEYTGMLAGYNLITICAEAFSPYLISPELTPTLYQLSQNGILFENYYSTFQSLTSNGEYAMCTGLYPNMYNTSGATSFEDSISNYLPYALGNCLGELGYACYAYHNNVGEFYSRNLTHANMGYTFKAAGSGLDITLSNPSSDLEMFETSVPDLVAAGTPFVAHYMTWSGHHPYDWTQVISQKNRAAVEDLPYSETVQAYLACNLELEYGLAHLMATLEDAGLAEKTVIVLTTDHFPYGLDEEAYNELVGYPVDQDFEKYHSGLIFYVPGLEQNITVSQYCSNVDILPTILNLFGVEYDSRLLAGRDIFSDGIHVAVLADQSFITEQFRFDMAAGVPADETLRDSYGFSQADYQRYVSNQFAISCDVLDHDYYAHVFGQTSSMDDAVLVDFADIGNVFHKSAVQYVTVHDLMDADSPELFGGERETTVGELLQCFCRISDVAAQTPAEVMDWAMENGIVTEADGLTADSPVDHLTCCVLMRRYARWYGAPVEAEEQAVLDAQNTYPEWSVEQAEAAVWATTQTVVNKTVAHVNESQGVGLNRFQLACYVSYLCTRNLGM